MKYAIGELTELIMEYTNTDWEIAMNLAENPEFFEIWDEEYFEELMGDVPQSEENILEFYRKDPSQLEGVVDGLMGEDELRSWNVNAWRNS